MNHTDAELMRKLPHRRYTLSIEIGADEWREVIADLKHLAYHIEEHGEKCSSVMGGSSCGHTVNITIDPEMTHEQYFAALDVYTSDEAKAARERDSARSALVEELHRAVVELAESVWVYGSTSSFIKPLVKMYRDAKAALAAFDAKEKQ